MKSKKIVYPCVKCNTSFHNKVKLKNHQESIHTVINDDLQCTECSFKDKTEDALVQHMEYCHPAIFSPHKVKVPSTTQKQLKCFKCDHLESTEDNLIKHMQTKHIQGPVIQPTTKEQMKTPCPKNPPIMFSKNTRVIMALLGDSITHNINTAEVERQTSKFIHLPGRKGSAGAKTRRCYTARRGKRFPENNFCEKLPIILGEAKIDNLILQASANDITNLKDEENMEEARAKAEESSRLMVHLANRATREYPQIKKVVILTRPPRLDALSDLSEKSNIAIKEEAIKYRNDKMNIVEHNIP